MSAALDAVASAAQTIADEQHQVAVEARAMQRLRNRGWSWSRIANRPETAKMVSLVRSSGRKLAVLTRSLSRHLAEGMSAEGRSRREIGRLLDMSHQRVTQILAGTPAEPEDP